MSRRTRDLPPRSGLPHLFRELRYSEPSRQILGVLLMPVFAYLAQPKLEMFAVGGTIAIIGMLVRFYASGFIVKNKQLATNGPYSLVRHPLYTGNLLLVIGFTIACNQWWAPLVAIAFWFFYYPTAIEYEDRKLHGIFETVWEEWSATVPAVIPRSLRMAPGGSWSFETSWSRNYEAIIVVYTILCLAYIGRQVV